MVPAINIWSMRVCRTKLLVARNSQKVSLVQRASHFQTWMSSVSKLQLSPTMLVLVRCKNSRTSLHCWSSFQWKSNWGHESSCWMCLVRFDLWYNSSYLNMWRFFWGLDNFLQFYHFIRLSRSRALSSHSAHTCRFENWTTRTDATWKRDGLEVGRWWVWPV